LASRELQQMHLQKHSRLVLAPQLRARLSPLLRSTLSLRLSLLRCLLLRDSAILHRPVPQQELIRLPSRSRMRLPHVGVNERRVPAILRCARIDPAHSHLSRTITPIPHTRIDPVHLRRSRTHIDPVRLRRSRALASIPRACVDPARLRRSRALASIPHTRTDSVCPLLQ